MNQLTRYLVCLGLSLSLTCAAALFALVGIQPKNDAYGNLPWIYCSAAAVGAVFLNYLARRLEPSPQPATIKAGRHDSA